jgi:hypothetical protein
MVDPGPISVSTSAAGGTAAFRAEPAGRVAGTSIGVPAAARTVAADAGVGTPVTERRGMGFAADLRAFVQ